LAKFPAKRLASFFAILFVIGLQSAFLLMPTGGLTPYRQHERSEAIMAWMKNPSNTTKAALDHEKELEHHHYAMMFAFVLMPVVGSFLAVDTAMFYVYWRCWVRKVKPNNAPPALA
jgi:hypothetical protein